METFSLLMADAEKEGVEYSSEMPGFSALESVGVGWVVEGLIRV